MMDHKPKSRIITTHWQLLAYIFLSFMICVVLFQMHTSANANAEFQRDQQHNICVLTQENRDKIEVMINYITSSHTLTPAEAALIEDPGVREAHIRRQAAVEVFKDEMSHSLAPARDCSIDSDNDGIFDLLPGTTPTQTTTP